MTDSQRFAMAQLNLLVGISPANTEAVAQGGRTARGTARCGGGRLPGARPHRLSAG
ncbi:MAG: hypothetical protein U5L11_01425 [Arhodomonas sp.]|nr:hypothetical protein [Arhodomonas sp.]